MCIVPHPNELSMPMGDFRHVRIVPYIYVFLAVVVVSFFFILSIKFNCKKLEIDLRLVTVYTYSSICHFYFFFPSLAWRRTNMNGSTLSCISWNPGSKGYMDCNSELCGKSKCTVREVCPWATHDFKDHSIHVYTLCPHCIFTMSDKCIYLRMDSTDGRIKPSDATLIIYGSLCRT